MFWAIDMDGVLWRGEDAIAGAATALTRLREAGSQVCFVTNNSAKTAEGFAEKLHRLGFDASPEEVLHAGRAVATLVKPGERVLSCALEGVAEALADVGAVCVQVEDIDPFDVEGFDAVIIGGHRGQTLERLATAMRAVRAGARLLAPSGDPMYPSHDGTYLGGGAMTHAVAYSAGVEPTFAGKPFAPMVELVRTVCGEVSGVIGDQLSSDGGLARALDVPFVWVQTGVAQVAPRALGEIEEGVVVVDDFAAAVDWIIACGD